MTRNLSRPLAAAALAILLAGGTRADAKPAVEVDLESAGAWTFRARGSDAPARPIAVPAGGWRLNGFPAATAGVYERRIKVPKLPGGGPQTTLLSFESVNWEARIFVGPDANHLHPVGEHLSAWTPFRVDISSATAPGETATVRVEVRDRSYFKDSRGRFTVPAAAEWNDRAGRGILRGVSLQIYPSAYISDIFVKPSTATGTLTCLATLTNSGARARSVTIGGSLAAASAGSRWRYPSLPDRAVTVPAGGSTVVDFGPVRWTPGRASWWWPNVPYQADYHAQLHLLRLSLRADRSAPAAQTEEVRFGFCTPGQSGSHYSLNGVRINLRGDSLPEGTIGTDAFARLPGFLPPTKSGPGWPGAVRNYQRLNFNVIRMHQVPATRYMMDVCDDLGLLVIPETAIRGGGISKENIEESPAAFETHLRELVLRDRNHPSVFKWSLENELFGAPEPFIHRLYDVCRETDGTRPCSIDDGVPGIALSYPSYPDFAIISHYSQPAGTPDAAGPEPKNDRPYGEGEFVWPAGNTPRGPVLFGLMTRSLRAHDSADIRPYTLIDLWPGVIPGLKPGAFPDPHLPPDSLEQGGQSLLNPPDPFQDARLLLVQRSFSPIAVYDTEFDARNTPSNGIGEWPSLSATMTAGAQAKRRLVVFNDTFRAEAIEVRVEPALLLDGPNRQSLPPIIRSVPLEPGEHASLDVGIDVPVLHENRPLLLSLSARVAGKTVYHETVLGVAIPIIGGTTAGYLDRDARTLGAWPKVYGREAFLVPAFGGVVNGQTAGFNVNRGVGIVPDRAAAYNTLNLYPILQSAEVQWVNQQSVEDSRVPLQGPGIAARVPVAFKSEDGVLCMRADMPDGQVHRLSFYMLDYFRKRRSADITLVDLRGNRLATHHIDDMGGGVYEQFRVRGSVVARITSGDAEPAELCGMFIDPSE